jgi:hypothetical protein
VRLVGGSLGLGTEVGGGSALAEEAADHRLEERVEDDLGTAGLGQSFRSCSGVGNIILPGLGESHPEDQDELEDVVEGWDLKLAGNLVRKKLVSTYGTSKRR